MKQGTAFYTKELILDVENQMGKIKPGKSVHHLAWRGVDGRQIETVIQYPDSSRKLHILFYPAEYMYDLLMDSWKSEDCRKLAFSSLCVEDFFAKSPSTMNFGHWEEYFKQKNDKWVQSNQCRLLAELLENDNNIDKIDKVICFGLGDFTRDEIVLDDSKNLNNRAVTQHAAAITIAQTVRKKTGKNVRLLAQDPGYSAYAERILEGRGFKIYKGVKRASHGFVDVDEATFVVSICPHTNVRGIIADITRPAMMFCDGYVKGTEDERQAFWEGLGLDSILPRFDPDDDRTRDMFGNEYIEKTFISKTYNPLPSTQPFANVFLYSRKDDYKGKKAEDK
ncbi:hypothetical protein F4779DRAFT_334594 [Xylariaceae sp. FL0662B]|nr:hypothetical protein F4779DRAFT_334594 [Xylariaceae sp. FL0662B]